MVPAKSLGCMPFGTYSLLLFTLTLVCNIVYPFLFIRIVTCGCGLCNASALMLLKFISSSMVGS